MSDRTIDTTPDGAIGLVGLGQMGLPICQRLATSFDVVAFDISDERRAMAADERVSVTDDVGTIASLHTVVLSLPSPQISRRVVQDLAGLVSAGTLVIETSTVLPEDVREWAQLLEPAGARVIDAAVLSGVAQMESGRASLLVGGAEDDLDAARDVLETLGGGGVTRFGPLGTGMAAKVVNNGVAHAVMVVLVEAFAMAEREGVQLADIADMLNREDGGLQRPLNHRVMERVARSEFDGGMPLEAARKDSTLALAMAQRSGVPLFAIQAAQSVYDIARSRGLGREDYSAVARLWEEWTGHTLTFGGTDDDR